MSERKKDLTLDDKQKEKVRAGFKKSPDLKYLTEVAWGKKGLDGRSKEGKAVRQFLIDEGLNYDTAFVPKLKQIDLTDEQKEFLLSDSIETGMKPLEVARLTFSDPSIVSLSLQHRTVQRFLEKHRPDIINKNDLETSDEWKPPLTLSSTINRVSKWTSNDLTEERMSVRDKKGCEALFKNLKSIRFISIINNYSLLSDRELFESEFIRATWDKPDLTNDELNLYITVCSNYVRIKHVQKRLDNINRYVQESEEPDVHMRVTEQLKTTSEELNQIEKRIESLINKLNGDRAKRLAEKGSQNVSILALVEAWQTYEERERMVMKAQMENKLLEDEAGRLESMDQLKARILGISKEELI